MRHENAKDAARAMVDLALERGGADNISVIVVRAVGTADGDSHVDSTT
jgi:serine/threonine protein phosphatase PrpC